MCHSVNKRVKRAGGSKDDTEDFASRLECSLAKKEESLHTVEY